MVDIFPAPGSKGKLKSLGFVSNLANVFKFDSNPIVVSDPLGDASTSDGKKPSSKRARADDSGSEASPKKATSTNETVVKKIRLEPEVKKNEIVDEPEKKVTKTFKSNKNMDGNFRRLNMKGFRMRGKSTHFSATGKKFKRFLYNKNKQKIQANARYGVKLDDDDDSNDNFNLIRSPSKKKEKVVEEKLDEHSNEAVFAKLKKQAEEEKKANKKKSEKKKAEVKKAAKSDQEVKEKPIKKAKPAAPRKKKSAEDDQDPEAKKTPAKKKSKSKAKVIESDSEETKKIDPIEEEEEEELPVVMSMSAPQPILELEPDGELPAKLPDYAFKLLEKDFGHKSFKKYQQEAIIRIACGMSTLVILSTGYGKSLIYQFAARLYAKKHPGSTVLVVSPLISLMQDQLYNLSKSLKAAVCDSQMSDKEYSLMLQDLNDGRINILFMSPEAIINRKIRHIPRLAFVCIDEVHCLSQWSHNFRPSYLQLCQVLKDHYNVKCFLGLTATATDSTIDEIRSYFDIEKPNIIKDCDLPQNLLISASKDINKDKALVDLLKSEQFRPYSTHVIVYCSRREQTEKVSHLLRLSMQPVKRKPLSSLPLSGVKSVKSYKTSKGDDDAHEQEVAEAYHAGLSGHQRKRIQNQFIKGKLRIIVATMAFGMGINMSNIRAIIHYNMPKSIENYVQEIGRAGRDGQLSRCHLFLETQTEDVNEIKRYVHMNGYEQLTIKKLVITIFDVCSCETEANEFKHNVALPISDMVDLLDIKEETILTLLCYLNTSGYIEMKSNSCYKTCFVRSYKGPEYLVQLAARNELAALMLKQKLAQDKENKQSEFSVDVMEICEATGQDYDVIRQKLKQLEWDSFSVNRNDNGMATTRTKSGLTLSFQNSSFYLKRKCIKSGDQLDEINDYLWKRVKAQMDLSYSNFKALYKMLHENSFKDVDDYTESFYKISEENTENLIETKSNSLKEKFNSYFNGQMELEDYVKDYRLYTSTASVKSEEQNMKRLVSDIRKFIYTYENEMKLNGTIVARIFHGIGTPKYPNEIWGRNRVFWRSHLDFDFETIIKIATEQLIKI